MSLNIHFNTPKCYSPLCVVNAGINIRSNVCSLFYIMDSETSDKPERVDYGTFTPKLLQPA